MNLIKKMTSLKVTGTVLCLAFVGLCLLLTTSCSTGKYDIDSLPPSFEGVALKKYVMKQKIWTLGDKFVIKDETRTPVFYVKGKVFSFGDKLSFRDTSGKELAYISQKVFSLRPRYKIYRDKELIAKIVKKITLFKDKYTVHISGPDDLKVTGNFWNYEYTFTRNGRKVAFVSKKLFSWSDTYGIAIAPGEDDILILAAAVVIDMISHGDQHHHVINDGG
ncbi:MAG: LURP-one-related family protein [Candidatus Aminicenantes bacterium]|nr:MAG: LURP-one-related family protein [Candidatus Aminicenantes bacterium]